MHIMQTADVVAFCAALHVPAMQGLGWPTIGGQNEPGGQARAAEDPDGQKDPAWQPTGASAGVGHV
jgi:hypothetical protein